MKYDVDERLNKIAKKLNIRNKRKKLQTAEQINQLAIMLIEMRNIK